MRSAYRTRLIPWALAPIFFVTAGCGRGDVVPVPGRQGAVKSAAQVRAERRAYGGAPPTIPHEPFGVSCDACHNARGISVDGVGYAPASPHEGTAKAGATARCRQCHVFAAGEGLFIESEFVGLTQNLRSGGRATPGAPPTIPHRTLMRDNCVACHAGPGAREEIRTSHPARWRCRQCHVPVTTRDVFQSAMSQGLVNLQ